ncbi:hypothetical protein AB0C51_25760 [Streptomyces pathocidini]|uniref:hypothetical protein n=1 Tax=Streptomyces pathocidini TaxID=1650571 RepID=UPI0033DB29DA
MTAVPGRSAEQRPAEPPRYPTEPPRHSEEFGAPSRVAVNRQPARGKLTARERTGTLDPGSSAGPGDRERASVGVAVARGGVLCEIKS